MRRLSAPQRIAGVLALLFGGAILAMTLAPSSASNSAGLFACLVCGDRGWADAILNVVLFIPLGMCLSVLFGGRLVWPALLCGALSAGIELAQYGVVPGRDASMGDLLFNSSGGALGALLVWSAAVWLRPHPLVAGLLSLGSAVIATGVVAATGALTRPSFTTSSPEYFGLWTPDLQNMGRYHGQVRAVTVGPDSVPQYEIPEWRRVRERMLAGETLHVDAVAGPADPRLAPIYAIYTRWSREELLLGADEDELVYRFRMRSVDYRLDMPDIRVPAGMRARRAGEPLRIEVSHAQDRYCIAVSGPSRCDYGFTAGRGWGLLMYVESFPPWMRIGFDAFWLALWGGPVGLWLRLRPPSRGGRAASLAALGLLALALTVVPRAVGLLPTPALELLGAAAGVAAGAGIGAALAAGRRRWGGAAPPAQGM